MRLRSVLASLWLVVVPCSWAQAAPLPAPVDAMIREAAKQGALDPVVSVARATNPDSGKEIDSLVDTLRVEAEAQHQQKLLSAGLWDNWKGTGQLGLSRTTGNTTDNGFVLGIALTKDGIDFRHKLNGQIDHQTTSGTLTRNHYVTEYQLDYKIDDRLFAFGNFGFDRDTFSGFSRRFSEAFGLGYSFVKNERMKLDINAGLAYRQTRYTTGDLEKLLIPRVALDYSWKILDNLTLSETASLFFNSALTSSTALTGKITDSISARVSFDVTHEDNVPTDRTPTDTATRLSLIYNF